ncbi:histidine phosphatase family protein [Candidatus Woesebacteria bacterium]|nr:histidine phosphatase family protein [Candidatus Woesebacteria bacterium]
MTTFTLIRHGDKLFSPLDPSLNELGHEQARRTAEYLADQPIQKIIASPLRRTQETAQYIAEKLNLPIHTDERLRERINWGDRPNQTRDDFVQTWIQTSRDRDYVPLGGQSSRQAGESFLSVITEQIGAPEEHIALVSHGGIISDFLRNIFTEEQLAPMSKKFPNGLDYEIKECSLTQIKVDTDFQLICINAVDHLV